MRTFSYVLLALIAYAATATLGVVYNFFVALAPCVVLIITFVCNIAPNDTSDKKTPRWLGFALLGSVLAIMSYELLYYWLCQLAGWAHQTCHLIPQCNTF